MYQYSQPQQYSLYQPLVLSGPSLEAYDYIDEIHLDLLLLLDILKTCPSFLFFDELISIKSIEQAQTLLHYDLVKINNSVLDILSYLNELVLLLQNLDTIVNNDSQINRYYDNVEWIYEGKTELSKIFKNVEGIDSIISQLLHIIESKLDETADDSEFFDGSEKKKEEYLHLLGNFDDISELSLQVKKYLIVYKRRLEIANQYHVLYHQVLDTLNDEIETCLKDSFNAHELKFSLQKPPSAYPLMKTLDRIEKIAHGRTDDIYPIFEDSEKELYTRLNDLKAQVAPMHASIEYVQPQITAYIEQEEIKEFYPTLITTLSEKFQAIEEKFVFLGGDLDDLRYELVEKKWAEFFFYLFNHTQARLNETLSDLATLGIMVDDQPMDPYAIIPLELEEGIKLVHRAVQVTQSALEAGLVASSEFESRFRDSLKAKWARLESQIPKNLYKTWFGAPEIAEVTEVSRLTRLKQNRSARSSVTSPRTSAPKEGSFRRALSDRYSERSPISPLSPASDSELFHIRTFSLSRSSLNVPTTSSPVRLPTSTMPTIESAAKLDTVKTPGPRGTHRRSLTGSLLIGRMNLQPVLVQGTPTLPEKAKELSERDTKALSTVESVDYDAESPLRHKSLAADVLSEMLDNVSSVETSRLEALQKLETGEKALDLVLALIEGMTLDDVQRGGQKSSLMPVPAGSRIKSPEKPTFELETSMVLELESSIRTLDRIKKLRRSENHASLIPQPKGKGRVVSGEKKKRTKIIAKKESV